MLRLRFASLLVATLFAAPLHAGFVLDDFDDPAVVVSPGMDGEFLETANVGALAATREIRIYSSRAPVDGSLDANVTAPSALTFDLDNVEMEGTRPPIVSYQWNYEFPTTDLTDGGANNAFLIDFESFRAEASNPELRIIVWLQTSLSNVRTYAHTFDGSLLSEEAFTVPLLFKDLSLRGGGPGNPDLIAVGAINLEVTDFSTSVDARWQGQINAVRIDSFAVPEPASILLAATAISAGVLVSARCVRCNFPVVRKEFRDEKVNNCPDSVSCNGLRSADDARHHTYKRQSAQRQDGATTRVASDRQFSWNCARPWDRVV